MVRDDPPAAYAVDADAPETDLETDRGETSPVWSALERAMEEMEEDVSFEVEYPVWLTGVKRAGSVEEGLADCKILIW